jgi:hypothetical protein
MRVLLVFAETRAKHLAIQYGAKFPSKKIPFQWGRGFHYYALPPIEGTAMLCTERLFIPC